MPVVDVTMQNQILDAWLGTSRAAGTPGSYDLELWAGDPRDVGSAEVSGGGYVAQSIDADDFNAASGGSKSASGFTTFPAATGAYSDTVTHYALRHPTTSGIAFCAPLADELDVTGAGDGPKVRPVVFFADPD